MCLMRDLILLKFVRNQKYNRPNFDDSGFLSNSFNNKRLFLVFSVLFAWLTLPIKYLDYFMENNSMAYINSSGIYVLARKKD